MSTAEQEHWVDSAAEEETGARFFSHLLLAALAAFFVAFLVWADNARLDIVTRGNARIIPSSQVQVIQNLEGGILEEVLVTEGQVVEKGQVLLRVNNTRAEADFRDLRQRYLHGLAVVARLEAEIAGKTEPKEIDFDPEVTRESAAIADAERNQFRVRQSQLETQLSILREQVSQREQEISELNSRVKRLNKSLSLANQELEITRPMAEQGVVAKTELLQKERELNDLETEIESATMSLPRIESALAEARQRLEERRLTFESDASEELSKTRQELASVKEAMTADKDRVVRTDVRSPVHGAVKEIKIRTIGGVIQPGQDLMEVVPIEDTLLVEARILPKDIAFLHPKLAATVKVTAYDFSIYGGLDAVVEQISADAIEDKQEKQTYFRVYLRTDRNFLGTGDHPLPIIPGMTASVDILTGEKTVLDYLLKPIFKARDEALRER